MVDRFIFLCHCVLDLLLSLFLLELGEPGIMSEALMASGTSAFETMGDFAGWALVIFQVLVLKGAEVVAVVRAALKVATWVAGLHNHFPLESLPPFHFLIV